MDCSTDSNPLIWHKRAIGLNQDSKPHYFDHLAPICALMQIPLLVTEKSSQMLVSDYYPDVEVRYVPFEDFSPEFLIANYDLSLMSDLWDRDVMHAKFEALEAKFHKRWRNIHCPHGFSDKGFYLSKCAREDIVLLYGDNMIDQLKAQGVWQQMGKHVITGNYRYSYYLQHRAFYDQFYRRVILSQFDSPRTTILYAPTWMDLEKSTSYFTAYSDILDKLPDSYNLIVKLHPQLENDDIGLFHSVIGRYSHKRNVAFIYECPLIFPLLAHSDIYIGDMSSVGYDFLAFNRPMFFLNQQKRQPAEDPGLYLFRCGTVIAPEEYCHLYDHIERHLHRDQEIFSDIRQQVWNYTFGHVQRSFKAIRREVIAACE